METKSKAAVVDPDYEVTEFALELMKQKEDNEKKEILEKATEIINREFQIELQSRQSQLELIENRLNKAQKTLHLLRYVIINSYYNQAELMVNSSVAPASDGTALPEPVKQSKIHPAVKKLLGKNSLPHLFFNKHILKRNSACMLKVPKFEDTCKLEEIEEKPKSLNSDLQIPAAVNHKSAPRNEEKSISTRNRKKFKHRIVVGNISKWVPSESEEDGSTHKWMVYVRGPKDQPDISHIISKVVLYLHPSYKPNDVVELKSTPFHLSRRGWGEFPLRVQIFFQCSLNKPVDIIHNLKLDRKYTGRQMLGNETVIDFCLYNDGDESKDLAGEDKHNDRLALRNTLTTKNQHTDTTFVHEEMEIKQQINDEQNFESLTSVEHDYCYNNLKKQDDTSAPDKSDSISLNLSNFLFDHSYCINSLMEPTAISQEMAQKNSSELDVNQTSSNNLVEELVLDNFCVEFKSQKSIGNYYDLYKNTSGEICQKIKIGDGRYVAIKRRNKPQQSLLKSKIQKCEGTTNCNIDETVIAETIDYEKFQVHLPKHRFKVVSQALPYLFKRIPIISNLACDLNFKCTYPFVAKSDEEFASWNVEKRLSSEWFQAKTIQRILSEANLADYNNCTTKSIIMFARSFGYTPLANYKIFENARGDVPFLTNRSIIPLRKTKNFLRDSEVPINVLDYDQDPSIKDNNQNSSVLKFTDYDVELECSFIRQTALGMGVVLKSEEIVPGVLFNGAERMLLSAISILTENLIRKARANLVRTNKFNEETTIECQDIYGILCEDPEYKVLLDSMSEINS